MTSIERPFCWPCRHYRPPTHPPGMYEDDWSFGTCAAFPDDIPETIMFGGFDHRDPHPDDGGVQFERKAEAEIGWSDQEVTEFLDQTLSNFEREQERIKALRR